MVEMNLGTVNKEIKRLENEKYYILDRIENIISLVRPKSGNMEDLRVDGGSRVDKILLYTEINDEMVLAEQYRYIKDKLKDLKSWRNRELQRLENNDDDLIQKIVYYKEEVIIKDKNTGRERHLNNNEVANMCYCSIRTVQYKYKQVLEQRKKDNSTNTKTK